MNCTIWQLKTSAGLVGQIHVGHTVAQECCYPHVLSHSNERARKILENYTVKSVPTIPLPPLQPTTLRHAESLSDRLAHVTLVPRRS